MCDRIELEEEDGEEETHNDEERSDSKSTVQQLSRPQKHRGSPEHSEQIRRIPRKLLNSSSQTTDILRRQPRPHQTKRKGHHAQVQESTSPHTPCESDSPMEEVIQHDGMDDTADGRSRNDDTHHYHPLFEEMVRHYAHCWEVNHTHRQTHAETLRKEDLYQGR
jgi:hypothetical protein